MTSKTKKRVVPATPQDAAVFLHQAFQRAKPHDHHRPLGETDKEYQRIMLAIGVEIIDLGKSMYSAGFEDCRKQIMDMMRAGMK